MVITILSLAVAILSLLVTGGSFVYHIRLTERGPVRGKPKPDIKIGSQVGVKNHAVGYIMGAQITIGNFGTAPLTIESMNAYVAIDGGGSNQRKSLRGKLCGPSIGGVFTSLLYRMTIKPGDSWSGYVGFMEDETEEITNQRNDLSNAICMSVLEKYLADPAKKIPSDKVYELSPEIYDDVRKRLSENIVWMATGTYQVLFTISPGKEPLFREGYRFRMTETMLKYLRSNQPCAYSYVSVSGEPSAYSSAMAMLTRLSDVKDHEALVKQAQLANPAH